MIEAWIRRWVHYSVNRPWLVVWGATMVAGVLGFEAQQNFNIRSDLADLLPDTKSSVANHRWVYQFAGAPEIVEPIIAVREPLADQVIVIGGEYDGRSQDIGHYRVNESNHLEMELRAPLLPKDGESFEVSLEFNRDRKRLEIPALSGKASQKGTKLTLEISDNQTPNLKAFLGKIRAGDPNKDGIYAMDVAKKGLATIAKNLEALENVVFVLHRVELEYFKDNLLLFAEAEDLKQLKCCIQWKQKESLRAELSLDGGETIDDEDDDEEDEDEDDPFADDSSKKTDPDCAGRTLDNDSCGLGTSQSSDRGHILPEYFVSTQGYLAMFVRPRTPSNELAANKKTQIEIRKTIARTLRENEKSFGWAFVPESLQLGGGFVARHDAVRRIESDLFRSIGVTLTLLFLILLGYYRRGRALVIVLFPLVYGVTGALGVAFLTIGYLNLITTFIFAVLLGLGIDFGIHIMNRYMEERRTGESLENALTQALNSTGIATAMGAVTTAASFASLMLTAFPGFSQFGLIAGIGVPLCLINVFVLIPPVTALWERWRPIEWSQVTANKDSNMVGVFRRILNPRVTTLALVGTSILICASLVKIGDVEFEYDMRNVRSLNPEMDKVRQNKSGTTEGLTLSPAIALANDQAQASRTYDELKKHMDADPEFDSVEQLLALNNLIPREQKAKLELIGAIRDLLRKKRDFVDNQEDKEKVDELYSHTKLEELTTDSIPESLLRFFRGKPRPIIADVDPMDPTTLFSGLFQWMSTSDTRSLGHFVFIFPGKDMTDVRNCIDFSEQMGTVRVDQKPLLMSASQFVYGDLLAVVQEDGSIAVSLAFYAVFLFVLLDFAFMLGSTHRFLLAGLGIAPLVLFFLAAFVNLLPVQEKISGFRYAVMLYVLLCVFLDRRILTHSIIVLTPLLVSFVVLLATLPVLGWRINFFNVVVFPTILGIGVDSGIHIYHRFLEEGEAQIPSILRFTGSSISLATLTTGIGFGAMINAAHLGLQSIAKLAILGLTITLISAVVFFPCLLSVLASRGLIPSYISKSPTPGGSH